jgi:hypothetical protein
MMADGAAHAARILLMFVVLPVWVAAGLTDYFCHRYCRIEDTSGPPESVLHLVQLGLVGLPIILVLFLDVNAGLLALCILCILLHHAVAYLDIDYATHTRRVTPFEQMVHSVLEIAPITAFVLLDILYWPQLMALFGLGPEPARFAPALRNPPLPLAYVGGLLGATIVFNLAPYLEELIRTLRAKKAPVSRGLSA